MRFVQLLFDFVSPLVREKPRARGVRARPASPKRERAQPKSERVEPERVKPQMPRVKPVPPRVKPRAPRGIDHSRRAQQRYDAIVEDSLAQHGLRVRRWRNSLSGLATLRIYRDGSQDRTIESPYPTSPLRLAIFLHEVGHHVIGLGVFRPRCLEEFHAWRYAIDRMNEMGLPTEGTVQRRFERSMQYAVAKSVRRGIRALPVEVAAFSPA
ncbi:MAG: hypothetical protein DWI09_05865 [Planctomycetota bacterium]|jgi:hypothetical protein|nr:MAG: hypothetical protein DWI09_05865 [Planctomycetota bacterium]RLT00127.1 MAG: hypothetical protein DWI16_00395 [Planctomycetota bacterium]